MRKRLVLWVIPCAVLFHAVSFGDTTDVLVPVWTINQQEYFDAPAASVLVFHDYYPEGKQGGIEIIQHDERVAANGDLRLEPVPGQWGELPKPGKRSIDAKTGTVSVPLSFEKAKQDYTVSVRAEGDAILLRVDLAKPLPAEWTGKVRLNIELYPPAYFGKTYSLGKATGIFPRQANGPMVKEPDGDLIPKPLAIGNKLILAPDDPERHMVIEQVSGDMELLDGRNAAQNGWFVVSAVVPSKKTKAAVEWKITPNQISGWRRTPVIGVSQVGYHPDQEKRAVIELDSRSVPEKTASLLRINSEGGFDMVSTVPVTPWQGKFLRYEYAYADFSSLREPGMYVLKYGEQTSHPFRIGRDVYQRDVWQPSLETYLPVQMCHMEVRDLYRVWHGACHLDDAIQTPAFHEHFDGYRQSADILPGYSAFQHIPGFDRGGWHDAGDYDLQTRSQAFTTQTLAMIAETFKPDADQVTVLKDERKVLLHVPDGIPDIVQQVAHGTEFLLSAYRVCGRGIAGIIEGSIEQYVHLGDASTITDNKVYDPSLKPGEVRCDRSGTKDDRWAFTDSNPMQEFGTAAALANAARVLKGYEDKLADECLVVAVKIWENQQSQKPSDSDNPRAREWFEAARLSAAAQLLMTANGEQYRSAVIAGLPVIQKNFGRLGWIVVQALPKIGDDAFRRAFDEAAGQYAASLPAKLEGNPYGVPFSPQVWGVGWDIQNTAMQHYFLVKAYPDRFDREMIFRGLNWVLGCHPGSNTCFVAGVGSRARTMAYGFNRADWSYTPGEVASGTALIHPDFPEFKEDFPFLWQQAENIIGGAATYIFDVLAAEELLNGNGKSTNQRK